MSSTVTIIVSCTRLLHPNDLAFWPGSHYWCFVRLAVSTTFTLEGDGMIMIAWDWLGNEDGTASIVVYSGEYKFRSTILPAL